MHKLEPMLNEVADYKELISGEVTIEPLEPKAFCSSLNCMGAYDYSRYNKLGVQKYVKKTTVDCPDCGNSLFWVKDKMNGRWTH